MALSQSGLQENAHRNKKGIVVNLAKFDYIHYKFISRSQKCDLKFSPKQTLYYVKEKYHGIHTG